jgi:two-component system, sensor histidine kinase and response regulator
LYSPEGSPITLTLQQAGDEAIVTVRDRGIGITDAMLPHIFERFYQAPGVETRTGSRARLGLGLYISREIVEQHGGRIEVQSSAEGGTAFSIVLPTSSAPPAEHGGETTLTEHEPSPFQPPPWLVS